VNSQPQLGAAADSGTPAPVRRETGNGETILVVDDDAGVRELVNGVLTRRNFRVLAADSAAAAQVLWAEHRDKIQLVLTDIVMPGGVSGGALAAELLRDRPDLPVLLMSGYARDAGEREALSRLGMQMLQKPFTIEQLVRTVRAHLAGAGQVPPAR